MARTPRYRRRQRQLDRHHRNLENASVSEPSQFYRQNRQRRFRWRDEGPPTSIPSCLAMFVPIHRLHWANFVRYCAERRCSPKQLRTIEALYIDGLSLRAFARLEGVEPQAITSRINALANKAPEFYRWWRGVNASHSRSARQSSEKE